MGPEKRNHPALAEEQGTAQMAYSRLGVASVVRVLALSGSLAGVPASVALAETGHEDSQPIVQSEYSSRLADPSTQFQWTGPNRILYSPQSSEPKAEAAKKNPCASITSASSASTYPDFRSRKAQACIKSMLVLCHDDLTVYPRQHPNSTTITSHSSRFGTLTFVRGEKVNTVTEKLKRHVVSCGKYVITNNNKFFVPIFRHGKYIEKDPTSPARIQGLTSLVRKTA